MLCFDKEWLAFMRDLFPKGTQIQCGSTEDHIPALSGKTGTIEHIDDLGLFHCSLEDGRTLVSAIDEGYFQINLQEQTEPHSKENYQTLKDRNLNLPKCGKSHRKQRMEILNTISSEKLPEWAADVLFPPLRSILVLPGEEGKIVEAGALGRSIRRQLHADHLECVGDCSENESINIYCDQDAKTKCLPFNRCLHGMNYYGPILINGMHEEDRSLTDLEIANLLQCLDAPSAFQEKRIVSEINKDTFWTLINQGREQCGQDVHALAQWLEDRLMELGPEQALNFDYIAHAYRAAAYKYGLWNAASIMCDGCTDDGFTDFRGWLIAQGRDVYMAALKDPDSLADVPTDRDCCCETLCYVGSYAYEELTGRDINQDFDPDISRALAEQIKPDIVYGEGIGYPYTWSETAAYLPKLCAKYMEPEELAWLIGQHNDTWNVTSLEIQEARKTAQKSKKVQKRGDAR